MQTATCGRLASPLMPFERPRSSLRNVECSKFVSVQCSNFATKSGPSDFSREPTLSSYSSWRVGGHSTAPKRQLYNRAVMNEDVEGIPVGEYGERIIVPSYDEEDEEGEIKMECDESGCVIVMPKNSLAEEADGAGFLRCDLTGCYFFEEPPQEKSFEVIEGEGWRLGYETAPDSEESFCAIVGAGNWSVALTASEFNDFCNLVQTLRKGLSTMDEDGVIGKDDIVMQVERGSVWMECTIPKKRVEVFQNLWKVAKVLQISCKPAAFGMPKNSDILKCEQLGNRALIDSQQKTAFELRFILSGVAGRRQAEGYWPAEAVMDMLKKVDASTLEREYLADVQRPAAANA